METLIVRIKQKNKSSFTKELLKSFNFLEVKEEKEFTSAERKMIKSFSSAFNDVELSISGKKKLKSLEQVLDEL
ncbi:MAG: hypothetical protein H0V14_07900 [Chitinophagaceae bacterium]|nr:hypothetical protein [Chitinophagaceae bacterium]